MDETSRLGEILSRAPAVLIGAGAGLSASAGYAYSGERFRKYFADFEAKYRFRDMYSGGFYPYETPEEFWAYWSRYIFINRYMPAPRPVYEKLLSLVREKDYFVLTTNVDHCFQRAGFDKKRLFYTQGDYGLFQCSLPCHNETYDNEETVRAMFRRQRDMRVPTELLPRCPVCGRPMTMNLRSDDRFVEDAGWYAASDRYNDFIKKHTSGGIVYLELGVGMNTPGIIKYNFWRQVSRNPGAFYLCVNKEGGAVPREIAHRCLCLEGDIGEILNQI